MIAQVRFKSRYKITLFQGAIINLRYKNVRILNILAITS